MEKIYQSMVTCRVCSNVISWYDIAFFIRLAWQGINCCAIFKCERINLGAYEASLLADVYFRNSARHIFHEEKRFLVCKA